MITAPCVCEFKARKPLAGEPYSTDLCRACWLALNNGHNRTISHVQGRLNPDEDCIHLGYKLPAAHANALHLSPLRDWFHCEKGHGVVCKCLQCRYCDDHEGERFCSSPPYEWISTRKLVEDTIRMLIPKLPPNIQGVVGLPRSGMLPATLIATHLHLPLFTLAPNGLQPVGMGRRGQTFGFHGNPMGKLLVVDDTVYSGASMIEARERIKGCVYAAVYARPEQAKVVDLYGRLLPSPHLLEWNFANNQPFFGQSHDSCYGNGVALDFDGILCYNPPQDNCLDWIPNAPPLYLPRVLPVRLIVTARLESWRKPTEEWLGKWGVRWEKLIMHPAETVESRAGVAEFKAMHYAMSQCGFFVESEPEQARQIAAIAKKPVICPAIERVF